MPLPRDLTSPGRAFARQAAMEAKVTTATTKAMRAFLASTLRLARREGAHITPAAIGQAWSEATAPEALALPAEQAAYVSRELALASTPADAYTTIMAVFRAGAERSWSAQLLDDALVHALTLDEHPRQITAAAPARDSPRGKALRAAFDEALGATGKVSWLDAARRDARTATTGLYGSVAHAEMRAEGASRKQWVSRRDKRVREAHVAADGQTVETDQPFIVGGYSAMYPGDPALPARLRVNCRCVMVAMDDEAEFSAEHYALNVYDVAREAEPAITEQMKRLAAATHSRLEGLDYRLKEPKSLARKIASDAVEDGLTLAESAEKVSDAVRYTVIQTERAYARTAQEVISELRDEGWAVRVKNAWAQDDRAYQGINLALRSPEGQNVELQVHTQASFDAKMNEVMHGTYEKQRVLDPGDPQRDVYEKIMRDFMAKVPVPPGARTVS